MGRGEAERPQGSPMFMAPGGAAAKGMPPQKFKEMSYLERKLGWAQFAGVKKRDNCFVCVLFFFFLRILIGGGALGTRKAMDTISLGTPTDQEQQMAPDRTKQEQRRRPISDRLHTMFPTLSSPLNHSTGGVRLWWRPGSVKYHPSPIFKLLQWKEEPMSRSRLIQFHDPGVWSGGRKDQIWSISVTGILNHTGLLFYGPKMTGKL